MTLASIIPAEVQHKIFAYLPMGDLQSCIQVSRGWVKVAIAAACAQQNERVRQFIQRILAQLPNDSTGYAAIHDKSWRIPEASNLKGLQ